MSDAPAWEKLGCLIEPDEKVTWMVTHTGSAAADAVEADDCLTVYVTGRDKQNRSLIGAVRMRLGDKPELLSVGVEPVLGCGTPGAFDENGVSYPSLVRDGDDLYMYYTGWMPTVLTPFQNQLGLAVRQSDGTFKRVSRAPILPRNNDDYLSIGSVCAYRDADLWRLYYTAWTDWGGDGGGPKHRYVIKYASSADGRSWHRDNLVVIDTQTAEEHSICRPTVVQHHGAYHMWYCARGDRYQLGYAWSLDGVAWTRADQLLGLGLSADGFDDKSQAYPNVFEHGDWLYMLYAGNDYGAAGLGMARLPLDALPRHR